MRTLTALLAFTGCDERDNPQYGDGPITNDSRALYPEGPYGWAEGDTMPNWEFVDADGKRVTMQNLRATTFASTLVLMPSAEWMDASKSMLRRAVSLFDLERDDVLMVSAVFEDGRAQAAGADDAVAWQASYEVPWEVIAEPEGQFRLAWRDDMRAAVLINLDTMKRLSAAQRPSISDILWP